jgi:hypothetical protein
MSRCPHSGGRRAHPVLWRVVNPNFGASFAARAVVPAQRTTPLRALGGTSRDRAFPITDPRIPMANANRKAPGVARFGPGRLASNRAVRCQSPPAENLPSYVRVRPARPDELVKGPGAPRGRCAGALVGVLGVSAEDVRISGETCSSVVSA